MFVFNYQSWISRQFFKGLFQRSIFYFSTHPQDPAGDAIQLLILPVDRHRYQQRVVRVIILNLHDSTRVIAIEASLLAVRSYEDFERDLDYYVQCIFNLAVGNVHNIIVRQWNDRWQIEGLLVKGICRTCRPTRIPSLLVRVLNWKVFRRSFLAVCFRNQLLRAILIDFIGHGNIQLFANLLLTTDLTC